MAREESNYRLPKTPIDYSPKAIAERCLKDIEPYFENAFKEYNMKREEQDKNWVYLSQEGKERIRKDYNNSIQNLPIEESKRGVIYSYECLFGEHNLKPTLTYEDVAKELFGENNEKQKGTFCCPVFSENHCDKISAINALICVAKFLNKNEDGSDWVPDWENEKQEKYSYDINCRGKINIINIYVNNTFVHFATPMFAKQAVEILGENVIRTALGNY